MFDHGQTGRMPAEDTCLYSRVCQDAADVLQLDTTNHTSQLINGLNLL